MRRRRSNYPRPWGKSNVLCERCAWSAIRWSRRHRINSTNRPRKSISQARFGTADWTWAWFMPVLTSQNTNSISREIATWRHKKAAPLCDVFCLFHRTQPCVTLPLKFKSRALHCEVLAYSGLADQNSSARVLDEQIRQLPSSILSLVYVPKSIACQPHRPLARSAPKWPSSPLFRDAPNAPNHE